MKSKIYASLFAKRVLVGFGLVTISLSVASQAQAKNPGATTHGATVAVVFVPDYRGKASNSAEIKARLLHAIEGKAGIDPKLVKVVSKECGCTAAAPQEFGGFFSCLRGCLADVGISPYALIMCGAACAAAETGVGAVGCAICVGVSITVLKVCALGCAVNNTGKGYGGIEDVTNIKHSRGASANLQAKLRLQPARGKY